MGAPPGVVSSKADSSPLNGGQSDFPRSPAPAGSGAPASSPADAPRFAQAPTPVSSAENDVNRRHLAHGLRLFSEQHFDSAKIALQNVSQDPLAKSVLENIRAQETRFQSGQHLAVVKAFAQDVSHLEKYPQRDKERLEEALAGIGLQLQSASGLSWKQAAGAAEKGFDAETLRVWQGFNQSHQDRLSELESVFQESDRSLLAKSLMRLAESFRSSKHFGTSWTLAQLAKEFPETESRAGQLIGYLEGRRTSTEYVISDMLDQGGSSLAINLLSVVPAVAGARRLSLSAGLLRRSFLIRGGTSLLAGGLIHWGSTKALMGVTGYDGQIMPRSFGEFGSELASSAAQAGLALLLSNRMWKLKSPAKTPTAEGEALSVTLSPRQKLILGLGKGGRALWWSTKTSLKVTTLTGTNLATQWGLHAGGLKNMTPRGFPVGLVKTFFPQTHESREAVAGTYAARNLFKTGLAGSASVPAEKGPLDSRLNLDLFLTKLDPSLEGDRRELAYAVLAEADFQRKLGLNIRRWILNKIQKGEWPSANKTLETQGIPLRFDKGGALCFIDSEAFPCPKSSDAKP